MVVLCFQILYFTDPCCSPLQAIDDSPLDPVGVVGGEVNVPVCVSCLPVDSCCQPVSPSCDQPIQERKFPILLQPIIYWMLGLIVFRCSRKSCYLSLTSFQEDSWYVLYCTGFCAWFNIDEHSPCSSMISRNALHLLLLRYLRMTQQSSLLELVSGTSLLIKLCNVKNLFLDVQEWSHAKHHKNQDNVDSSAK